MKNEKKVLCSIKNEGLYILEWVAYYKVIGFDEIIIVSNDNDDYSDLLLHALHEDGIIKYLPNCLKKGESPQFEGYRKALESDYINVDDWLLVVDIDEFIFFPKSGSIGDLVARYENVDAICIPWKHFGSSGHSQYSNDLVINRFIYTTDDNSKIDNHFKSIFKVSNEIFNIGIHKANFKKKYAPIFIDPVGNKIDEDIIKGKHPTCVSGQQIARINHYSVKSYQEFQVRRERGNGFNPKRNEHFSDEQFSRKDINSILDKSITQFSPLIKDCMNEMMGSSIAILDAFHCIEGYYQSMEFKFDKP